MTIKPRSKAFLEALPKNGNKVKPAAIAAGYSKQYAHSNGKKILQTALREQAKDIIELIDNKPSKEIKPLIHELMGLSRIDIINNAKYLLNQEKDLSTRLKVLAPILAEMGINIVGEEQAKTIVPILNITMDNGSTEPHNPSLIDIDGAI